MLLVISMGFPLLPTEQHSDWPHLSILPDSQNKLTCFWDLEPGSDVPDAQPLLGSLPCAATQDDSTPQDEPFRALIIVWIALWL
jgi:hypothetical protein